MSVEISYDAEIIYVNFEQLLDAVFVIFGIIKAEKLDITKTESNNCFIMRCFKENNEKRTVCNTRHPSFFSCFRNRTEISKPLLTLSYLPFPDFFT